MPKNIVQDVIPRDKRRSIREVPLNLREEEAEDLDNLRDEENEVRAKPTAVRSRKVEEEIREWDERSSRWSASRIALWTIGVVSFGILFYFLSNFFSGATILVTPKTKLVNVDATFTAKAKPSEIELGFTPITLVRDRDEAVPADGVRKVETRASGRIIIYNNYSTASQRLVKNTRFETPDGLVYKISESVTVPGRKVVSGKIVPGSTEAVVYAESTGEEYNIGLTDFTVPGFKSNLERYVSFYGRSKTAMTGGKIGSEKYVSDEKLAEIRRKLDTELETALRTEATTQVPVGSILFESAYKITFEPVIEASGKDKNNNVTVRERGRFTGFALNREALAKLIAQDSVSSYDGLPVEASNLEALKFTLGGGMVAPGSSTPVSFDFALKGQAQIVWKVDGTKLRTELVGKGKDDLTPTIAKYPSISRAEVVFSPIWKNVFPSAVSKIKIQVQTPAVDSPK